MSHRDLAYLEEMGIECWDLAHPERLEGFKPEAISLDSDCSLLFVSPVKPEGETVEMFEKVLKSMKLSLEEARHLFPEHVTQIKDSQLKWIWFAGCDSVELDGCNILTSPLLSDIDGNNQERRALWQQICSYDV